jgi:hypothetical protein
MDSVILLYCSGSVNDQLELIGMRRHALTFEKLPQFNELFGRARSVLNVGCDLRLHGKYDMGGNRPVYIMLPLESEDAWKFYETCARDSRLKGAKVVSGVVDG